LDKEERRAAILEVDPATGQTRVFASGLRNPNGMAWEPDTGVLWTVVNERDELGSDLVPDYLASVTEGGFYAFSYYGQHVDPRVTPQRPDLVAKVIKPEYALGNHTASLGLAFSTSTILPERYRHGAFIGQHGSWNRTPRSGYKVIFVPFSDGRPSGLLVDVLTGFVSVDGAWASGWGSLPEPSWLPMSQQPRVASWTRGSGGNGTLKRLAQRSFAAVILKLMKRELHGEAFSLSALPTNASFREYQVRTMRSPTWLPSESRRAERRGA